MSVAMMQRVMREGSPRKDESSRWAPAMSTSRWDTAVLLGAVLALVVAAWPRAISTDVVLVSHSPRFVDAKALAARYGDYDQEVPASVLDAVFEYERRNNPDLVRGGHSARNEIPVQELCDAKTGDPKLVRAVFQRPGEPDVCGPDGTGLGRQTYYERALLKRQIGAETPLSPEQLTFDLARMEQSEYRRYRGVRAQCRVVRGGGRAGQPVRRLPARPRLPRRALHPQTRGGVRTRLRDPDRLPQRAASGDAGDRRHVEAGCAHGQPARELTDKVEQARTEAPANTCLRREGPTNATAFTVSWKADPGTMNNWLAILIGLFVALLIGYVFWRGTPAKGK